MRGLAGAKNGGSEAGVERAGRESAGAGGHAISPSPYESSSESK